MYPITYHTLKTERHSTAYLGDGPSRWTSNFSIAWMAQEKPVNVTAAINHWIIKQSIF